MKCETIKVYKGREEVTINKEDVRDWNLNGYFTSTQRKAGVTEDNFDSGMSEGEYLVITEEKELFQSRKETLLPLSMFGPTDLFTIESTEEDYEEILSGLQIEKDSFEKAIDELRESNSSLIKENEALKKDIADKDAAIEKLVKEAKKTPQKTGE